MRACSRAFSSSFFTRRKSPVSHRCGRGIFGGESKRADWAVRLQTCHQKRRRRLQCGDARFYARHIATGGTAFAPRRERHISGRRDPSATSVITGSLRKKPFFRCERFGIERRIRPGSGGATPKPGCRDRRPSSPRCLALALARWRLRERNSWRWCRYRTSSVPNPGRLR